MKEVVSAHLNGRVFQFEKDAYQILAESIKNQWQAEVIEEKLSQWFTDKGYSIITVPALEEACKEFNIPFITSGSSQQQQSFVDQLTNSKLLRRPRAGRTFGGVCGAIANYLGTDKVLIRVLFVIAILLFGSGLLLYLILWIVIPEEQLMLPDK